MKSRLIVLLVLLAIVSAGPPGFGEDLTPAKKEAIRELMEITGAASLGEMFSNTIIKQKFSLLRQTNPEIPAKALAIIQEEVSRLFSEEIRSGSFYEVIYPLYHKYFTLEEIQALVAFYKTPLGEKIISTLPKLTEESILAGQEWAQSLEPKLQRRLLERLEEEGVLSNKKDMSS